MNPVNTGKYMGEYISKLSNHPEYVKRGAIKALHSRTNTICSDENYLKKETGNIFKDFSNNDYDFCYIKKDITRKHSNNNNNNTGEVRGSIVILYSCEISEKIRIVAVYRLITAFHSQNLIGKLICNTTPNNSKLDSKNVMYSLLHQCGALYFIETGRSLGVCISDTSQM